MKITYVGHSLGGMVLPMYLIHQKLRNLPHLLSHAILLSPAGLLSHSPYLVGYGFGWFSSTLLSKLTSHVALPSLFIDFMQKLQNDISTNLPAARDLITFLTSKVLGGFSTGDSPVWKSAQLIKSSLLFGFSTELCTHFY